MLFRYKYTKRTIKLNIPHHYMVNTKVFFTNYKSKYLKTQRK